jgi:hypothetical protein
MLLWFWVSWRYGQLVLAGGNLTHEGSRLTELLKERLQRAYPRARISLPQVEASVAAALLAKNSFLLPK